MDRRHFVKAIAVVVLSRRTDAFAQTAPRLRRRGVFLEVSPRMIVTLPQGWSFKQMQQDD